MQTGSVRITSPMSREDQVVFDWFRARKVAFQAEIEQLEASLRDEPDTPYRKQIEDDIAHDRKIVAMISKIIGD